MSQIRRSAGSGLMRDCRRHHLDSRRSGMSSSTKRWHRGCTSGIGEMKELALVSLKVMLLMFLVLGIRNKIPVALKGK